MQIKNVDTLSYRIDIQYFRSLSSIFFRWSSVMLCGAFREHVGGGNRREGPCSPVCPSRGASSPQLCASGRGDGGGVFPHSADKTKGRLAVRFSMSTLCSSVGATNWGCRRCVQGAIKSFSDCPSTDKCPLLFRESI